MESLTDELMTDIEGLLAQPARSLGETDWAEMTQEEVDAFAELTGDRNFIHIDPERAAQTPFGGTIAHGLLSLALVAPVTQRLQVVDAATSINYGLDKLRFPNPLRVGDRWRATAEVTAAEEISGGVEATIQATIEVDGASKPAVVACFLIRFYR